MTNRQHPVLLAALTLASVFAVPAQAADVSVEELDRATRWAQGGDVDKDHHLSKAEVLALIDKAFADADKRKAGKLDMKQVAMMLREFDPRANSVRPAAKP